MDLIESLLTGRTESHVVSFAHGTLHRDVVPEFMRMREAAAREGIDLKVFSGYRSFAKQLAIWNGKARGEFKLRDDHGQIGEIASPPPAQLVARIARWTAIPGSSRHHWGTDLDVIDGAAVNAEYKVQLSIEESRTTFARLHSWLDEHMHRFGFFRPYGHDRGGVHPEPWHLSFAPLSERFFLLHSFQRLHEALRDCEIELKQYLLEHLPQLFERYFHGVDHHG